MKELFVSCFTFIHRMSSTGNSNYFNFWGSLFLDQCCCRKFIEWITRKCCHRPSYTVFYAFFPNSPVFISSVFYLSWDRQRILHRFNWTTDETKKQYNKDTTKKKARVFNHDRMAVILNEVTKIRSSRRISLAFSRSGCNGEGAHLLTKPVFDLDSGLCELSLLLVFPCSEGFSMGSSAFLLLKKKNLLIPFRSR